MIDDKTIMCDVCKYLCSNFTIRSLGVTIKPANKYYYSKFTDKHFNLCDEHVKRLDIDKLHTEISREEYLRRERLQAFK